jgi:hypothetical protein
MRRKAILLSLLGLFSLIIGLVAVPSGATAAPAAKTASAVKSSSLGQFKPTFVGPAATGCASAGCSLLVGPFASPSTASISSRGAAKASARSAEQRPKTMESPTRPGATPRATRASDPAPPSVSCQPLGPGCNTVSTSPGGATGVKGINAVDSATLGTNVLLPRDIEPPDQGLCAGNGSVVETNNIGEILVFNKSLQRKSAVIPLDTLMGLTGDGFSSGGDPSCIFDASNGGHWFFTQFVSTNSEFAGGPFTGCFAGVAQACLEGIAVSKGSSPFGPYNVYFLRADYNPAEPGYPYLLNDFAKIATTRDAFLLFYDEFPLNPAVAPGLGGGGFNGAQEFAFNKKAMERGLPVTLSSGKPNPAFTVAIENMGLLRTPDGSCAGTMGAICWYQVIPAQAPDSTQFDNSNGGSGFMFASLDFTGKGDNRIALFDWTGLGKLNSPNCSGCSGVRFGGQLFTGVLRYFNPGVQATQKTGPIPLGNECGPAGLSIGSPAPASCPENGIATNGDGATQAGQAQGQIWGAVSTVIDQTFSSESKPEAHIGAVYYVVGTGSFDRSRTLSLTSQGYVTAAHEDLAFPAMAAEGFPSQDGGNGQAIMSFTLTGNGGPNGADNGGFFPSSAYGRLTSRSNGLSGSVINVADPGQSPQDGFTQYLFFPSGPVRPRWGDYGGAIFMPGSGGKIYFASEYIQSPNCMPPTFTLTLATCGGTRNGLANWGTSVNSVMP